MENSFETSFIPQQPIVRVEGDSRKREQVNFALILAFIIFFITITVAGGIYFYKLQVDKRVNQKEEQLKAEGKNLNFAEIKTYKHINDKLAIAKELLQGHTVFSTILLLIEGSTAQNIGFTSLAYLKETDGGYLLTLSGKAPSYSAVYFQSEVWRGMAPMVNSVHISNPSADEKTGIVSFTAELMINPAYTKYSKIIEAENELNKRKEAQSGTTSSISSSPQ